MTHIVILDSITFVAAIAALVFILTGWRRLPGTAIPLSLAILLLLTLLHNYCRWAEWSGLTSNMERFEDFTGALIPMMWAFVSYAYIQHAMNQDLIRSKEEAQENEERLQLAIMGADLATWDWHVDSGELILNHRWAEIIGYRPEEIAPQIDTWEKLVHPEDMRTIRQLYYDHLDGKTGLFESEQRLKHKQGHWVWGLGKGRVTERDPQGRPLRVCGTLLDITDRKQQQAQLQQLQKIEAIGRMTGGIAHDFNNLLVPILSYGQMLHDDPALDEQQKRRVHHILRAGQRAGNLVQELLAFCRKQKMRFKSVDLNRVLTDFGSLLRQTIPRNVKLHLHPSPDIPPMQADATQIERILMNLTVNAADAMPQGGDLTIETGVTELDARQATPIDLTAGRYVTLRVRDTGCGMDTETQARVFEPFFTTKDTQGTGLGLATVFGIVKQHQGSLRLRSQPGQGTTFEIYFPTPAAVGRRNSSVVIQHPLRKEAS